MKKKLALLLGGVLLLLPLSQFFGADLQVKANETKNSDPKSSDGLGSRGKSSGDLNSGANNSKYGIVEGDKDHVGVDDESKLSSKTEPKNVANTRNIDAGSDNQKKNSKTKKVDANGGIKEVTEEAGTSHQVEESKKGFDGDNDNDVRDGSGKDYDSELVSEESKDSEGAVGSKENAENKENGDQGEGLKGDENREDNDSEKEGLGNDMVEKHTEDDLENKGDGKDESSSGGDDCYSSYKCSDEENKLIACLRVPGNDSPHLSLLIQNKGNESLTVEISAPDFVRLESTKVQLQKTENKQVEVSIGNGGKQSSIVLTSGNRVCNLDFKDLMTSHRYLRLPAQRPTLAFLSFSALLIVGSGWMCLSFRRRKLSSRNVAAYQKMDSGGLLPVTNGPPKQVSSSKNDDDGWDESWGDDWDDEEAPRTPSKPFSPSFSSKQLASWRSSKETRKD